MLQPLWEGLALNKHPFSRSPTAVPTQQNSIYSVLAALPSFLLKNKKEAAWESAQRGKEDRKRKCQHLLLQVLMKAHQVYDTSHGSAKYPMSGQTSAAKSSHDASSEQRLA